MSKQSHNQRGFTLIEVIIYVAVVVLVGVSAVTFMISLQDVLARQQAERLITTTAAVAFDRILFEARQADALDLGQSIINSSSSVMVLDQDTDSLRFELATSTLYVTENGALLGPLTPPEVTVEEFYVYHYDNGRTELARVVAVVEATVASSTVRGRLEGAVQLRGSYE